MLHYDNPYPDNRDPISGDYTPISYNEVKRARAEGKRMAQEANSNKQMYNMLKSIMK